MVAINLHGILYSNDPNENKRVGSSRAYDRPNWVRGAVFGCLVGVPILVGAVLYLT